MTEQQNIENQQQENTVKSNQEKWEEKPKKEKRHFAIGARMKDYEAEWNVKLDPSVPFLMRLDGHKFSKYTKPFTKPYDERISRAMIRTTETLVDTFNAMSGYTCSDEITLIFPVDDSLTEEERAEKTLVYNGKVQKMVSLSAGLASSLFTLYIREEIYDPVEEKNLYDHVYNTIPYFDSRVCPVPRNAELINNIIWRASYDYRRNSISGLAQAHFSQRQLNSKNTKTQLKMLEEKGIYWEECPDWYKYGTVVKKQRYLKTVEYNGETIIALRGRVQHQSIEIDNKFDQDQANFLLAKYWPEDEEVNQYMIDNNIQ